MASLAQNNVGKNPTHVSWNNKNTKLEGGGKIWSASHIWRLFTNTLLNYLHGRDKYFYRSRHSSASPIRKSASQQKKYLTKKYCSSDSIRCLAVMKMARTLLARKKQFKPALFSTRLYRTKNSYEIYVVEVCSRSPICLCGQINRCIKIMVLQIAQYT